MIKLIQTLQKKKPARSGGTPDPADMLAGKRLRARRKFVDLSQGELGRAVGVSFQQIQKYENGTNRISISRLKQLAAILDVSASYFTDEPLNEKVAFYAAQGGFRDNPPAPLEGMPDAAHSLPQREIAKLVSIYCRIKDPKQRRRALELIKTLVDAVE